MRSIVVRQDEHAHAHAQDALIAAAKRVLDTVPICFGRLEQRLAMQRLASARAELIASRARLTR
jgi:hypothetical protein